MKSIKRRDFLLRSCGALGLGLITGIGNVGLNSCSNNANSVNSGPPTPYDIDLKNYPALAVVNGFSKISIPGKDNGLPVIVIRKSASDFFTLSSVCTHQGCEVGNPDMSNNTITCNCHGSKFSTSGAVINGPARSSLTIFPNIYDTNTNILTITL